MSPEVASACRRTDPERELAKYERKTDRQTDGGGRENARLDNRIAAAAPTLMLLLLPLVAQRMYVRLCVFMPVCKPLRLLVRACLSACSLVCVCERALMYCKNG